MTVIPAISLDPAKPSAPIYFTSRSYLAVMGGNTGERVAPLTSTSFRSRLRSLGRGRAFQVPAPPTIKS